MQSDGGPLSALPFVLLAMVVPSLFSLCAIVVSPSTASAAKVCEVAAAARKWLRKWLVKVFVLIARQKANQQLQPVSFGFGASDTLQKTVLFCFLSSSGFGERLEVILMFNKRSLPRAIDFLSFLFLPEKGRKGKAALVLFKSSSVGWIRDLKRAQLSLFSHRSLGDPGERTGENRRQNRGNRDCGYLSRLVPE